VLNLSNAMIFSFPASSSIIFSASFRIKLSFVGVYSFFTLFTFSMKAGTTGFMFKLVKLKFISKSFLFLKSYMNLGGGL